MCENPLFTTLKVFLQNSTNKQYENSDDFLDVCFLRLDFSSFQISGPTGTVEVADSCPDLFSVRVSIWIDGKSLKFI